MVVNHVPVLRDDEPVKIACGPAINQPGGELAGEISVESADQLALVPVCGHVVGVVKCF